MRWRSQLEERGAGSFYQPQTVRRASVLTAAKSAECQRLLDDAHSIPATARLAGIGESTLRKAVTAGRFTKTQSARPGTVRADPATSTKSQRSQSAAAAAEGIGTACTRADERTAAAFGLADSAATRFESATDLILGDVVIFDREGSHHSLLPKLWEQRVGVITCRKNVTDTWPETEFAGTQVACPGGGTMPMRLAVRETQITARKAVPLPVLEVRRLTQSGHQTAIISTARTLASPAIAGRMFSRWRQENYFGYMMQHFAIVGLVAYGSETIPGITRIVNPAWRELDKQIARLNTRQRSHQAKLGAAPPPDPDDGQKIAQHAVFLETIQALKVERDTLKPQRRATPRKIAIKDLPEADRPRQLLPLAKPSPIRSK